MSEQLTGIEYWTIGPPWAEQYFSAHLTDAEFLTKLLATDRAWRAD